jgi:cytochrome b involved in lipid metabolism
MKINKNELELMCARNNIKLSPTAKLTVIEQNIYDIQSFIFDHPGGDLILSCIGIDGTCLFNTHHAILSSKGFSSSRILLQKYYVGKIPDSELCNYYPKSLFYEKILTNVSSIVNPKRKYIDTKISAIEIILTFVLLLISFLYTLKNYSLGIFTLCFLCSHWLSIMHVSVHHSSSWKIMDDSCCFINVHGHGWQPYLEIFASATSCPYFIKR